MKRLMPYRGLFALLAALLLTYPGFQLGQFLADAVAELPQAFIDRPVSMVTSISLNLGLVGALYWVVLVWPRDKLCKRLDSSGK